MNRSELIENIKRKGSFLCVGLDTDPLKIPAHIANEPDPIFASIIALLNSKIGFSTPLRHSGKRVGSESKPTHKKDFLALICSYSSLYVIILVVFIEQRNRLHSFAELAQKIALVWRVDGISLKAESH